MTEMDWTEKYRPKRLKDVLGNAKAVTELRKWAESWENGIPAKRGVILAGPAGTGKTSSAIALANEFGWSLIELNASDARNLTMIRKVATTGAMNQTFTKDGQYLMSSSGGRKLIVLDEADSLYEKTANVGPDLDVGDRGGKKAIIETLQNSKQPIILIVNDLYALVKGSGAAIQGLTITIKFYKIKEATIKQALRSIAENEKIKITPDVMDSLAHKAEGDLRACINDLQSIAIGRSAISADAVSVVGGRDLKTSIFDAVRDVFRGTSTARIRKTFNNVDETPENIILWIDENLPYEYKRPNDLVSGFNMLSRADVFLGRVRKRQYYKFQGYTRDLMTAGVASVKQHSYSGWTKYNFPTWLKKMSQTKESRALYNTLSKKIGRYNHISSKAIRSELIDPFKHLFKTDTEFAVNMIFKLELDTDEIAFLLNEKPNSNRVKSLLEEVKRHQTHQEEDEPVEIFPDTKKPKKSGKGKGGKKEETKKGKKTGKSEKKTKAKDAEDSGPVAAKTTKDAEDDAEDPEDNSKGEKKKEVQKSLFDF